MNIFNPDPDVRVSVGPIEFVDKPEAVKEFMLEAGTVLVEVDVREVGEARGCRGPKVGSANPGAVMDQKQGAVFILTVRPMHKSSTRSKLNAWAFSIQTCS